MIDLKLRPNETGVRGFFRRLTSCQPNASLVPCFAGKRKSQEKYSRNADPYSNFYNTD